MNNAAVLADLFNFLKMLAASVTATAKLKCAANSVERRKICDFLNVSQFT